MLGKDQHDRIAAIAAERNLSFSQTLRELLVLGIRFWDASRP